MKEEVSIIVIDDTNQETNIRALEVRLKKCCVPRIEQIHTGAVELRKNDGSDHFIKLPILSFNDREDYKDTLVELISKNNRLSLEDRLLKLLYTHENMVFSSCFPPFAGKTFGEIANIIETGSDARSEEWLQALIDQVMAYLLQVNE